MILPRVLQCLQCVAHPLLFRAYSSLKSLIESHYIRFSITVLLFLNSTLLAPMRLRASRLDQILNDSCHLIIFFIFVVEGQLLYFGTGVGLVEAFQVCEVVVWILFRKGCPIASSNVDNFITDFMELCTCCRRLKTTLL